MQWIIIATVDLSKGVEAETEEEALKKAESFIDDIYLEYPISNINLQGVIKA